MENCIETNIPVTDNTAIECPIFVQDTCVVVKDGQPFILSDANISLTDYNEKLIEKLVEFNQSITALENSNPGLINYTLTLDGTELNLLFSGNIVATVDLQSLTTGGLTEVKEVYIAIGGETTAALANTVNLTVPNQLIIEGITQLEGTSNDYNIIGNIVYFADPLQAGEIVQIIYKY